MASPESTASNIPSNLISAAPPALFPGHSPPHSQQQVRRRRRRTSSLQEGPPDPVIGHVTQSGKYTCVNPGCNGITFGRQADFKRHVGNTHEPQKLEYFCPEDGCARSKRPTGGKSKGRSFNNRKDKMEEHLRTVHCKGDKKRQRSRQAHDDDSDEGEDEDRYVEGQKEKRSRVKPRQDWLDLE